MSCNFTWFAFLFSKCYMNIWVRSYVKIGIAWLQKIDVDIGKLKGSPALPVVPHRWMQASTSRGGSHWRPTQVLSRLEMCTCKNLNMHLYNQLHAIYQRLATPKPTFYPMDISAYIQKKKNNIAQFMKRISTIEKKKKQGTMNVCIMRGTHPVITRYKCVLYKNIIRRRLAKMLSQIDV